MEPFKPFGLAPPTIDYSLPSAAVNAPPPDASALHDAAKQFEAIFLRRMLESARATSFDSEGLMGGSGVETFSTMRDERFADLAANRGALGIAELLEAQLSPEAASKLQQTDLPLTGAGASAPAQTSVRRAAPSSANGGR